MSTTIKESGMTFGPFEEKNLFRIEHSALHKSLKDGFKIVEFIALLNNNSIAFVEAKSSFARYENIEKFEKDMDEIYQKFTTSIDLYFSTLMQRHLDNQNEIGSELKNADYCSTRIRLYLVIRGFKDEWLISIDRILKEKMRKQRIIWKIEIMVINDVIAESYNLIQRNG